MKITTKERIIKHVTKNIWKYIIFLLCAGIAFSGFSFKNKYFSCNKTQPALPKIGSSPEKPEGVE